MSDTRRCFTNAQARILLREAEYRCSMCGMSLLNNHVPFDVHHVVPYSHGGLTELSNGLVLCRPCHRRIHKMTFRPRRWQKECMERFCDALDRNKRIFSIEATMGAGKSKMAAWLSSKLLEDPATDWCDHVIVCVPWKTIIGDANDGMLAAFNSTFGIPAVSGILPSVRDRDRQPPPTVKASIVTYAEVCKQDGLSVIRRWVESGWRFSLVLDEIHHTNELNGTWGEIIQDIQELAKVTITLSGTYFRTDSKPIRFLEYDENDRPLTDYKYGYDDGISEGVVRNVTFRWQDPQFDVERSVRGQITDVIATSISHLTTQKQVDAARRKFLGNGFSVPVNVLIETAWNDLQNVRTKFPDAAYLFIAPPGPKESQEDRHVMRLASRIHDITGIHPAVVSHLDRNSASTIGVFRKSDAPMIVAVDMISEGCDISRLRGVVFCRYIRSEMAFRQMVGRTLRIQHDDSGRALEDGTAAAVYLLRFPLHNDFASRMLTESEQGVLKRRCPHCDTWPCECPCPSCRLYPCQCPCNRCEQNPCICIPVGDESSVEITRDMPMWSGGTVDGLSVDERYCRIAKVFSNRHLHLRHVNIVQLGSALQAFDTMPQDEKDRDRK